MTKLYVVATPIGNLEDISARAKRILNEVAWIAAEDTRHSGKLLQHLGIHTPMFAYHQHNEQQSSDRLLEKLQHGESGALITDAGTPCISDPGFYLVKAARNQNYEVLAVPGASSVVSALSISGLNCGQFTFVGFLPPKQAARIKKLESYKLLNGVIVFFEAPHRIQAMLEDCANVFGQDRQAFLGRELTKQFEQGSQQTLGELVISVKQGVIPQKGEFVLVIEGALELNIAPQNLDELDKTLGPLLKNLPLKQAVGLAVDITGLKKNLVYARAVALKDEI